jgi:uracil-DNA glycosylase family 4
MSDLRRDIASILRRRGGGVLPWRGEEERSYLTGLLEDSGEHRPARGARTRDDTAAGQAVKSIPEEIASCTRCQATGGKKLPFGGGENGVMIMLNPPAMMGRAERAAYRKESAELLRKMCAAIDLDVEECYVTGTVKCEPAGASLSPGAMLAQCEHILDREITETGPRVILVMGDMLPLKRLKDRHDSARWFAVEHPVALIKNPDLKKRAWNTLKLVRQAIAGPHGRA